MLTVSSADAAYRPYISIDVFEKGPRGLLEHHPELLDAADSLYSNYMDEVKANGKAVFYQHNGYGGRRKPNYCLFQFSNLGKGVAYRFSVLNIKRYVYEESLPDIFKNDQGEQMYCCVKSNMINFPTCREFPVHKKDDVVPNNNSSIGSYAYSDGYSFPICVDIGPESNDVIEVGLTAIQILNPLLMALPYLRRDNVYIRRQRVQAARARAVQVDCRFCKSGRTCPRRRTLH
jgi:hypothetical protein